MFFKRKNRIIEKLKSSFGKIKTEGFNFNLIKRYHLNKDNSSAYQTLSDQSCEDLDFDLFFCYLDRTYSKIGQQYFYNKLRTIDYSSEHFDAQEKIIKYLEEHPEDRLKIQYQLQKLNHNQAYYVVDLFQQEIEQKSKWYFLFPILSFLAVFSIVLSFMNSNFILILVALIPINALIHYGLKRKTNMFLNSVPSLLALADVTIQLSKFTFLKKINPRIGESIEVISSIKRKMSFFKLEQKIDSDMEAAYWFLLELIKITFLLEPLLLFSSLDKLQDKSNEIEQVYRFVGQVDTLMSIESLRSGLNNYCIPVISSEASHVKFEGIKHPLVTDCVPNSINTPKSVLLSGSNMSGKTTFIRSIGLNYISGITINTCFATSAKLPIAKLFSVIRIEDDIMNSSSYFNREVDEIKQVINETSQASKSIILLDELFKGTNTIERIACAKSVLSHIATESNQVFVATHDIELTNLLTGQFKLYHFSESISESTIDFDFKLKEGILKRGNAIRILEMNNFPKEVIQEANALASGKS